MSEQIVDTISIVTDATLAVSDSEGEKGLTDSIRRFGSPQQIQAAIEKSVAVPVTKLEQEMTRFVQVVGRLFNHAEQQANRDATMQLDEIQLSIEITAEGEIKWIAGAKAGGKGAVNLTFKRIEPR